ncbi:hypothetical protein KGQ19_45250 [Catenulispora sp. NL8]|uniref:Uncharacterized protein n=1 Tax=Catenulispora pinistramenti TaxID=2705254 RepID=A0ABS5L7I0_9ACTN|nr:hypothetical protein [Catenulispora pinistramenti]MBS2554084.1 hypothetical protein [Catenulispora pinistramenti]
MTTQENDTSGMSYWDEPRGRTRVLILFTVAVSSLTMNAILLVYYAKGGVR